MWDSKSGFFSRIVLLKLFLFSHRGLPSLVRSKSEVLCLTMKFDFFSRLVTYNYSLRLANQLN